MSKLLRPFLENILMAVGMSTLGPGRMLAMDACDTMPSLLPSCTW
jgi:hypothetical protein